VLLAEDLVGLEVPVVVEGVLGLSGALWVEGYRAVSVRALDTGTLPALAEDAEELLPLLVHSGQLDGRLGGKHQLRDPESAGEVHPVVEGGESFFRPFFLVIFFFL